MNDEDNATSPGFFRSVASDDGLQRALAGVVVAAVVAGTKHLIFKG